MSKIVRKCDTSASDSSRRPCIPSRVWSTTQCNMQMKANVSPGTGVYVVVSFKNFLMSVMRHCVKYSNYLFSFSPLASRHFPLPSATSASNCFSFPPAQGNFIKEPAN